jgi:hypothetical protein
LSINWTYANDGWPEEEGLYLFWCRDMVHFGHYVRGEQVPSHLFAWARVEAPLVWNHNRNEIPSENVGRMDSVTMDQSSEAIVRYENTGIAVTAMVPEDFQERIERVQREHEERAFFVSAAQTSTVAEESSIFTEEDVNRVLEVMGNHEIWRRTKSTEDPKPEKSEFEGPIKRKLEV